MDHDTGRLPSAATIRVATRILCTWSFLVVLSCNLVAGSPGKLVEFPGSQERLASPDGRFVVENVDSDKEPHHTLRLKNTATGDVRMLCSYQRHVTVLWSPDGKKLAVNDYASSNFSRALVFSVEQDSPPQNIGEELLRSLKGLPDGRSLTENDHVYFAVISWASSGTIKLKVWGYGETDPKGFSRSYHYTLGGSFQRTS